MWLIHRIPVDILNIRLLQARLASKVAILPQLVKEHPSIIMLGVSISLGLEGMVSGLEILGLEKRCSV